MKGKINKIFLDKVQEYINELKQMSDELTVYTKKHNNYIFTIFVYSIQDEITELERFVYSEMIKLKDDINEGNSNQ